jgi:hypothetical protein
MPERELATTSEAAPAELAAEVAPTLPLAALGNQQLSRLAASNVLARNGPTPAPAPGATPAQTPAPGSSPDLAAYQESQKEREKFKGTSFTKDPHQPSTGIGLFAANYANNVLKITVRCSFEFTNSWWIQYPKAKPEDRTWQPGEADRWKGTFMEQIRSVWSGQHTFHCQRDWWESEFANTEIEVVEAKENAHFACSVKKIPPKEFRTSSVSSPIFGGTFGGGSADFDSNDINTVDKAGGQQRASVHEAGHMLGLDDEYGEADEKVDHSKIVEDEGGGKVVRGPDDRIMSGGEKVGTAHGATFLEVLQTMTKLDWGNTPKAPRPIPEGADGPKGDFPTPAPRRPGDSVPV